jgi:ABC-2 type transport system ATP-binding protein
MEHAEKLCDSIALIARGRVLLAGGLAAIKRERGGRIWRLTGRGPLERASEVAGVEQVLPAGDGAVRVALAADAAPGSVLRGIVAFADVTDFRSEEPDLETIFVRTVQDAH